MELRCLYLGQNMISHISGLESLKFLENLDLSQNGIHAVDNLSCLPKLRTLNLSGNKIRSRADVEHLTTCPSLTSLDLASNKIDDQEAVEVLKPLSNLSLLRLVGNPVVSEIKHYRKALLAGMPELKYLDESPVFEKDRRLAVAFVKGGVKAEREERDLIRQEEAETRERHRRNFEAMVANAKAKALTDPAPPHDPMRFRAVPPGESDSDDDSDLPPSCRVSRKGRGLKGKPPAHQAAGNNAAAAQDDDDDDDLPELEGMEGVEEPADNIDGAADDDEMADAADAVLRGTGSPDTASEGSSEDFVMVQQPLEVTASNEVNMGSDALEDGPPVPPPPPPADLRQDLLAELRKRMPASPSSGTSTPGAAEDAGNEESQGAKQTGRRGRGEVLAKRGPSVWGTEKYRQLWQMACVVGEQQEKDQQLEETEGEAEDWLHVDESSSRLDGGDKGDGPDAEEQEGEEPVPAAGAAGGDEGHNVAEDEAVAAEDVEVDFSFADAADRDGEPPEAEPVSPEEEQLEVDSDDEEEDDAMAEDDEDAELFERYCVTSVAGAPQIAVAAFDATVAKEAVSPCQEVETVTAGASEECGMASTASVPDDNEASADAEEIASHVEEQGIADQPDADDSNQLQIDSNFLDELD